MLKIENYPKAYVEVLEILKKTSKEDFDKIPQEFFNALEENKDKNYIFEMDNEKTFEEQEVLRETKAILAYIFVKYWSNTKQKEVIMQKLNSDITKYEKLKEEQYSNDVFKLKKSNKERINIENNEQNMKIIKYKKEKFLSKIFNKIKRIFFRLR